MAWSSSPSSFSVCIALLSILILTSDHRQVASAFKCDLEGVTCKGLAGYVTPNITTLSHIQTMFGVPSLHSLLAANNLPISTSSSYSLKANQTVNIPFPCRCSNSNGTPATHLPLYTVVKDDGLWHIASQVFGGLVTYQQIQAANNISDASLIEVGQKLWIPLPCSCDLVEEQSVVHYAHVVKSGSTLAEIAKQYDTTEDTLLALNDLASPKALLASTPLDVPLKACTSMVDKNSPDYPLLLPNGTYALTAGDCVMCKCNAAANNWTLQCEPSSLSSSQKLMDNSSSPIWKTCPSMQCQGGSLILGNTTISSCNHTTCSYAGYTNQTILTTLSSHSTCPVRDNSSAQKVSMQGWSLAYLLVFIHLIVISLRVVQ